MAERLQAWRVFEGMGIFVVKKKRKCFEELAGFMFVVSACKSTAVGQDLTLIYVSKHATSHAFGRRMQLDLYIVRQTL